MREIAVSLTRETNEGDGEDEYLDQFHVIMYNINLFHVYYIMIWYSILNYSEWIG